MGGVEDDAGLKTAAQRLRREYENLSFKDDESMENFALRLTSIIAQLDTLRDPKPAEKVVARYLLVARPRYKQLVISIEILLDVSTLTIEKVTGRLKAAEEDDDPHP